MRNAPKSGRKPEGKINDWKFCDGTVIAKLFGVTPQSVSKWPDCPRTPAGKYNLADVIAWRMQRLQDEIDLIAAKEDHDSPALERLREARADKAELEVAEARARVVDRAEVTRKWNRVLYHIIETFDGLGRMLAPRLAHREEKEIAKEIREEVHRAIDMARASMLSDGEI